MKRTLVIVSQTFAPDPASVGQHMTDVAIAMAGRGHRVKVYASARGYENANLKYPLREDLHGVDVRRLDFASFGKKSLPLRVLGTASFMVQVAFKLLTERNLVAIFFSTSPPLGGFICSLVAILRRVPVAYWAMDLNPDQLIALGKLKPASPTAKLLEAVNRFILRRSNLVVALDRFMAERLELRMPLAGRLLVMPPWPHENHIVGDDHADALADDRERNPFRVAHGLAGKFVVMYSGNHSPSNPLDAVLGAALRLKDDPEIRFAFVGGGTGKREVEAHIQKHGLTNAVSLPYQPIAALHHSLGAADLHVVSLGDSMVGIIHPCKVYGAMAAGRPILYLGPRPSHVSDLIDHHCFGWAAAHGDDATCARAIDEARQLSAADRAAMGRTGRRILAESLSQRILCNRFCDALESSLNLWRKRSSNS